MGAPANTNGSNNSAGSYQYNDGLNGRGASTTGTIYGIYDMAGGAWEYQMGWLNTASTTWGASSSSNDAGFSSAPSNHRYYEEYTTTSVASACGGIACYGQALRETAGWYGDTQRMGVTSYPWILRGGFYSQADTAGGVFASFLGGGYTGNGGGMRAVLV